MLYDVPTWKPKPAHFARPITDTHIYFNNKLTFPGSLNVSLQHLMTINPKWIPSNIFNFCDVLLVPGLACGCRPAAITCCFVCRRVCSCRALSSFKEELLKICWRFTVFFTNQVCILVCCKNIMARSHSFSKMFVVGEMPVPVPKFSKPARVCGYYDFFSSYFRVLSPFSV